MAKHKKPSASGASVETVSGVTGPLEAGQRWSGERKMEVALRLLRGEPMESLSRELGIEVYRLQQWKERALFALKAGLRERAMDPLRAELDEAMKRIGELTMENELLRVRCQKAAPFPRARSKR
jgi:transposase-like protein